MPMTQHADDIDRMHLAHAARLALRGHGGAEPNPMVGCVIVAPGGEVVGWGYHRRCGGPHAEVHALRRAGEQARGATAYITLEPCNHTGRTGPCTQALIDAGIARVVIARPDPHPAAAGGMQRLCTADIDVVVNNACSEAIAVSDPFVHRLATGRPWVIAKWAQTLDGRLATRNADSKWISGERSRRMVHRERGRVDVILTGIGTVIADDPMLNVRHGRARRTARRTVIDPNLRIPLGSQLVATADRLPTTIFCRADAIEHRAEHAAVLQRAGVELIGLDHDAGELSLDAALRELATRHDASTVLVEAGPGLLGRLFQQRLVNEVWMFIAPTLLGDEEALPVVHGMVVNRIADGIALEWIDQRVRDRDLMLRFRIDPSSRGNALP